MPAVAKRPTTASSSLTITPHMPPMAEGSVRPTGIARTWLGDNRGRWWRDTKNKLDRFPWMSNFISRQHLTVYHTHCSRLTLPVCRNEKITSGVHHPSDSGPALHCALATRMRGKQNQPQNKVMSVESLAPEPICTCSLSCFYFRRAKNPVPPLSEVQKSCRSGDDMFFIATGAKVSREVMAFVQRVYLFPQPRTAKA